MQIRKRINQRMKTESETLTMLHHKNRWVEAGITSGGKQATKKSRVHQRPIMPRDNNLSDYMLFFFLFGW